jgi:type III secretion protein U
MTRTEAKKDHKDQEGAPEIRTRRRRARNQLLQSASHTAAPTIVIEGDKAVVGMRFVRFETPLPYVVSKGAGNRAGQILADAADAGVPVYFNDDLAAQLFRRLEIGAILPEEFFDDFILALKSTGKI